MMKNDPNAPLEGQKAEYQEAFTLFDKDGDGYVSVEELQSIMEKLGEEMTYEEACKVVHEVDADGDGRINYVEFSRIMNQN